LRQLYPLHELGNDEFEELVRHICREILGIGTITFASGPDGGRDATFNGTAQKFPSAKSSLSGKFVIQAKHTSNPIASCSDNEFSKILDGEKPKLIKLSKANELDHYLVFTNRKKPANKTIAKEKELKSLKIKSVYILGVEQIREWLTAHPKIWKNLGFDWLDKRFEIQANDLTKVIKEFHAALKAKVVTSTEHQHFPFEPKAKKNKINRLSKPYFEYMKRDSLPFFAVIEAFLKNPRNDEYRNLYEDTACEIKEKIITHSEYFDKFDEALTYVADLITQDNTALKGKRRFASVFLHYMYFTCDIGQHDQAVKTS